nr:MAG TPA: hypothetical protein [Caudoviricetes sp.]
MDLHIVAMPLFVHHNPSKATNLNHPYYLYFPI